MQYNQDNSAKSTARPRLGRTRVVGIDPTQSTTGPLSTTGNLGMDQADDSADRPMNTTTKKAVFALKRSTHSLVSTTLQSDNWHELKEDQSTAHLMQLSGMMRAIRKPGTSTTLTLNETEADEDGYWPLGIQQAGPLPILNLYGREPFGRTLPASVPLVMPGNTAEANALKQPRWQEVLRSPIFKVSLGLLVGLGLLFLVAHFINFSHTLQILKTRLITPQGIGLALLAGSAFLLSHAIRGIRWKLFLNPLGQISTFKTIQIYYVAAFLNFLLPIRAGEVARSMALKRIANIPISKSLPTVAMDKSLDLLPAPIILVLLPVLGVSMDLQLWLVLGVATGLLCALLLLLGLIAWKRSLAISLLHMLFWLFPRSLAIKIEGFATGFVDALLAAASRPAIFVPALLLTALAAACDGLFALLAFWTVGVSISFGTVLFGYMLYRLFSILPPTPGQIGSNEAFGLLVFAGLLHLPGDEVIAMSIFSHVWTALLLAAAGFGCLTALNLTIADAMSTQEGSATGSSGPVPSMTA